jgi:hypothetical protein
MEVDKKDSAPLNPARRTAIMIYDLIAIVGVVVILGTIVGVLWAASRV